MFIRFKADNKQIIAVRRKKVKRIKATKSYFKFTKLFANISKSSILKKKKKQLECSCQKMIHTVGLSVVSKLTALRHCYREAFA